MDVLDFVPRSLIHNYSALLLYQGSSHAMYNRNLGPSSNEALLTKWGCVPDLARVYRLLRIKLSGSKHLCVSINSDMLWGIFFSCACWRRTHQEVSSSHTEKTQPCVVQRTHHCNSWFLWPENHSKRMWLYWPPFDPKTTRKPSHTVLLKGVPRTGKTMVLMKLILTWADGSLCQDRFLYVFSFLCFAFLCCLPEACFTQVVTEQQKHLQALSNMVVENGYCEVNLPDWYSPFLRGSGRPGSDAICSGR
jgi:hypothetical protein